MKRRQDHASKALIAPREYGERAVWPVVPIGSGGGGQDAGCSAAGAAPAPAAPSLSNKEQLKQEKPISRQTAVARQSKAKKVKFCLIENINRLAREYGTQRLLFVTLTFADHVTELQEASRRFNSFNSGIFKKRGYGAWVRIVERQKSDRIHFHLIVVAPVDIRTGYDPITCRGTGRGWIWLCQERRILRKLLSRYGFGRAEFVPLKKNAVAGAVYLAKYLTKTLSFRDKSDRGFRMLAYSRGKIWLRPEHFSWAAGFARVWRLKLDRWAFRMGYYDRDEVAYWMGSRWCYDWRTDIMAQPPSESAVGPFSQYHRQLIPTLGPVSFI